MADIDWNEFCSKNFKWHIADEDSLKVYVAKGKITADEYKIITGVDYIA
jgi:uncharacterized XkdX family phage protein